MKIIITVDFSNNKFNSDFSLSNVLLQEHTVLLVTNKTQLEIARKSYDLIVSGYSSFNLDKPDYDINALDYSPDQLITLINSK